MRLLLLPAVAAAALAKGIGIAIGATAVFACAWARKSRGAAQDAAAEETPP